MTYDMETVERAALEDLHAAAPADVRTALGVDGAVVGPAFVSLAAGFPPSAVVVNRAIGLGSAGDVDRDTVAEIIGRYQAAEIARYFVHLNPDASPPQIGDWLVDQGLEKARGWAKFERGREAAPSPRTDLDVRPATPDDADALDLGCAALGTETGEEVPGDPQHSYNNIRRAGFVETHVRANYAPPKTS